MKKISTFRETKIVDEKTVDEIKKDIGRALKKFTRAKQIQSELGCKSLPSVDTSSDDSTESLQINSDCKRISPKRKQDLNQMMLFSTQNGFGRNGGNHKQRKHFIPN